MNSYGDSFSYISNLNLRCIYSFIQQIENHQCPDTVLGPGDITMNKRDKNHCPYESYTCWYKKGEIQCT